MEIRQITPEDAAKVSILSHQLGYKSNELETANRIDYLLKSINDVVFVAVINEDIVGWIHAFYTCRIETAPFVEIAGLVVDSDHRKSGIGKRLIQEVKEWSATFSTVTIKVRCNTIRTQSHLFYQQLGFICTKEQKVFEIEV